MRGVLPLLLGSCSHLRHLSWCRTPSPHGPNPISHSIAKYRLHCWMFGWSLIGDTLKKGARVTVTSWGLKPRFTSAFSPRPIWGCFQASLPG